MPQRVFLTLGWLVSSLVGVAVAEQRKGLGSRECPLDISVLWTAEVDSPVYGTPIILPSAGGVGKQVVLATLRNVELLEGDGSVPYPWPIEMDDHDNAAFLAPPALYDVDGDGVQDICVADTMGWLRWLTPGDGGPYLQEHRQYLPPRSVSRLKTAEGGGGDGDLDAASRSPSRRRLSDSGELPNPATANEHLKNSGTGDANDKSGEEGEGPDEGEGGQERGEEAEAAEDSAYDAEAAAAYAEAMYQWGEYGTGPYPNDDGTGWLAYGDDLALDGLGMARDDVDVDPHISAAPVFFEVDGGRKRMVVSVSYFFTNARRPPSLGEEGFIDLEKFVAGSLACWDFKDSNWLWIVDLGQDDSGETERGAYVDASPTVADLDMDGKLEVLVGTVRGELHVLDASSGTRREGFPLTYDRIRGEVAVADVDGDQELEMLLADSSGAVVCVKHDGTECWNKRLPGSSVSSMLTLGDVDGNGTLDVVVAANTVSMSASTTAGDEKSADTSGSGSGQVWVLSAENGLQLPNFPVELHNRKGISAPVTLVDLHQRTAGTPGRSAVTDGYGQAKRGGEREEAPIGGWGRGLHLLAPSDDGHVYVIEGATGCVNKIDLGERVRSMVLADDVDGDGTLDLVVGTMSGEVLALSTNVPFHPLNAWTRQVKGPLNGFTHGGYQGIFFAGEPSGSEYGEMVGRNFALRFEIVDGSAGKRTGHRQQGKDGGEIPGGQKGKNPYQVTIFAGGEEIFRRDYAFPGVQTETVSLPAPRRALLRIEMKTRGQALVFEDHVFVGYNTRFHVALKWMIVGPMFLAALPFLWADRGIGGGRAALPG